MSKLKKLTFIFAIIGIALFLLAGFLQQKYVTPILMYHQVFPHPQRGYKLAVSTRTFQRQIEFLKKHRYNVVPLESLVALIKEKKKIPPSTVSITFDDGYEDNYVYAYPILEKYQLPATIFVIVKEVGRRNKKGELDRMSWEQLKIMRDSGLITIGSHSLGPDPLIKIKSEELLRKEIFDSKHILEEKLATKINLFSYPEGFFDERIRQLVIDAGYTAAVATKAKKNCPHDDIFALKRLRISENAGNLFVFAVETSGIYTFLKELKENRYGKK